MSRVAVCLVALAMIGCGSAQSGSAATSGTTFAQSTSTESAAAKSRYAMRGATAAIVVSRAQKASFNVYVRVNRKLPQDRGGDFVANVLLGEAGADASPVPYGRLSERCYVVTIGNDFDAPALREPVQGNEVPLSVRIGKTRLRRTVQLVGPDSRPIRDAKKRLGCGQRR